MSLHGEAFEFDLRGRVYGLFSLWEFHGRMDTCIKDWPSYLGWLLTGHSEGLAYPMSSAHRETCMMLLGIDFRNGKIPNEVDDLMMKILGFVDIRDFLDNYDNDTLETIKKFSTTGDLNIIYLYYKMLEARNCEPHDG